MHVCKVNPSLECPAIFCPTWSKTKRKRQQKKVPSVYSHYYPYIQRIANLKCWWGEDWLCQNSHVICWQHTSGRPALLLYVKTHTQADMSGWFNLNCLFFELNEYTLFVDLQAKQNKTLSTEYSLWVCDLLCSLTAKGKSSTP